MNKSSTTSPVKQQGILIKQRRSNERIVDMSCNCNIVARIKKFQFLFWIINR